MLTNPVILSILVMCGLCLLRFNVLLSILISAIIAGLLSGMSLAGDSSAIKILINGMAGNLETALSYILLGTLAAAIGASNLTNILVNFAARWLGHLRFWLCAGIAAVACLSQNLIPVHIAFIPVLIPPLLGLFNKLKIDRRAVACALTFGLQAPYVSLPVGFGLIYMTIIKDQLAANGLEVSIADISGVMWIGGAAMIFGLILALAYYHKNREYNAISVATDSINEAKMGHKEWVILIGVIIAFVVQLLSDSLPLGALLALVFIVALRGIKYNKMDETMHKGLEMMSFVAFVMLVAAGYAAVIRESGGIAELVSMGAAISGGQLGGAIIMLLIGLVVTIGIGSSFGTIPIIAAIYVPLCVELGFSALATILLVGIAGAVGDAGSPASDSTLGPTAGLNYDGQHNHIYDTCVPTFIFYNIPLIVAGVVCSLFI